MEPLPAVAPFALTAFRALRLADSHVGDPAAGRVLSRPYRSVPGRILEWRRKRRLCLDETPGLYLHEYTSAGVTIRGLVGLVPVTGAEGRIFPHEGVNQSQVDQLASRMEAMRLNPAPILLMHAGTQQVRSLLDETSTAPPHLVYTDRADQLHRIWRITDPARQALLTRHLAASRAVIADGHHRYAAAQRIAASHAAGEWHQTLAMLVDQFDTPLQLSAIHRHLPRLSLDQVRRVTDPLHDHYTEHPDSHHALAHLDHALVLHDGSSWATLEPRQSRDLLVRWLHEELLPRWGVEEGRVTFHHSASEAITRAAHGISVLLPAPRFAQVADSATSGRLLPAKATSFQPKPHLGVLMREIADA